MNDTPKFPVQAAIPIAITVIVIAVLCFLWEPAWIVTSVVIAFVLTIAALFGIIYLFVRLYECYEDLAKWWIEYREVSQDNKIKAERQRAYNELNGIIEIEEPKRGARPRRQKSHERGSSRSPL